MVNHSLDPVLTDFFARITPIRERIRKIILFGSRARGHALPSSDYDILIIVDKKDRALRHIILDAAMAIELATQQDISPKIYAQDEFDRLSAIPTPFMRTVLSEGITLDQAA